MDSLNTHTPGSLYETFERIPDQQTLASETSAWMHDRNVAQTTIDWRFTTADGRIKLKRLCSAILP